jgi:hypothetical protein
MEGQIRINTELEARLAELERRDALLTAFVVAVEECDWVNVNAELVQVAEGLFGKLTDAGFPWTKEPTT